MAVRNRIEVMHGVNLDQLGRRDPGHYGGITFEELEVRVATAASELGLETRFFHSNHEGEFVEHLHRLDGLADGVVINPGAWTHYAWAIRDALAAITINPARMFGYAARAGSIEVGKDADLVLWSGDPFETSTVARSVMIGGREQPLTARNRMLRDRYIGTLTN